MRRSSNPRNGSRGVYAILFDVILQLLVMFMILVPWFFQRMRSSQAVASLVPEMEIRISGLEGQLEIGRRDLTQAHRNGGKLRSIINGKDRQIGDLHDTVGQLTVDNGELRSRLRSGDPVTVVVLIDVTASMSEAIEVLRSSMAALFEFMPNTSSDFRVAILGFRNGVVVRFPVTPIVPVYQDGGKSQRSVLAFLQSLKAENGHTNHEPVFREALSMLAEAHPKIDAERKERIIFLGDMGPAELDRQVGYSLAEREAKSRILRSVAMWAQQGNRAVEALYAESNYTRQDPAAAESREWFEALGGVSQNSAFYTDTNALLRAILHASLD